MYLRGTGLYPRHTAVSDLETVAPDSGRCLAKSLPGLIFDNLLALIQYSGECPSCRENRASDIGKGDP